MKKYYQFILMWLVNVIIFNIVGLLMPGVFVFGNNLLDPMQASVVSGLILTLVSWLVDPFARLLEWDMKPMANMMFAYFLGNVVTLWFIARYSLLTGMGVSSVLWVVILSIFTFIGQYAVASVGMKKK